MTTAFAKVGLSGDYGGTYFLTQLVGPSKARELYLTAELLESPELLALGLVSRVVPDTEVGGHAARRAARRPPANARDVPAVPARARGAQERNRWMQRRRTP